jgi:hypothetical protein
MRAATSLLARTNCVFISVLGYTVTVGFMITRCTMCARETTTGLNFAHVTCGTLNLCGPGGRVTSWLWFQDSSYVGVSMTGH